MNRLYCADIFYVRSNRTIEVLLIAYQEGMVLKQRIVYLYNYEGIHYRLFDSIQSLFNFFTDDDSGVIAEFDCETDLDNYLEVEFEI